RSKPGGRRRDPGDAGRPATGVRCQPTGMPSRILIDFLSRSGAATATRNRPFAGIFSPYISGCYRRFSRAARSSFRLPANGRKRSAATALPRGHRDSIMPVDTLLSAFVTLLLVVDPLGLAPTFLGVTDGLPAKARRHVAARASIIAAVILAGAAIG